MSVNIEQGLFGLDFTDYHAILGVPVDADPKDIRKQYLKIVRRLHPDSCAKESEADRQRAAEVLSKLVNPAYEKLSQEKTYTEYCIILKLKGQQAQRQQDTILLTSDPARKLASAGDVSAAYRATLKELAEKQYDMLGQTLEVTGQISELNLVFLMRMSGKMGGSAAKPSTEGAKGSEAPPSGPSFGTKPGTRAPQSTSQLLDAYLRRAAEFEAKSDFGKAILELREAIQIDPKSSTAHSRLGVIYMKNNQSTMAKIHFNKALELNPQDPVALEGKRRLDITTGNQAKKPDAKSGKASSSKDGKPGQSGGGLFGLFGGKKK